MHYSCCQMSQMKSSICWKRSWLWRGFVIVSVLFSRGWVSTNFLRHVFARMIATDQPSKVNVATICSLGLVVPNLIWPDLTYIFASVQICTSTSTVVSYHLAAGRNCLDIEAKFTSLAKYLPSENCVCIVKKTSRGLFTPCPTCL